jgi:ABC-type Fe3+-citrate transport system substrate-binding protein
LGDGHIDQLIKGVGLYQIQSFLKLGIQASTEMITFAGISVRMITRILAQVVEDLCIFHDGTNSLSFRSMSPSGMWRAIKAVRNSSQVTT